MRFNNKMGLMQDGILNIFKKKDNFLYDLRNQLQSLDIKFRKND